MQIWLRVLREVDKRPDERPKKNGGTGSVAC